MSDDVPSKLIGSRTNQHNDQWPTTNEEQATHACERRIHCQGNEAIYKVWHAGRQRWVFHCPVCADEPFPDTATN